MGITTQSIIELHIQNCRCCNHYHLFYMFPVFDNPAVEELWLISTDRRLLKDHMYFSNKMWSRSTHKCVFRYGAPMFLLESAVCLLDIPARCVMLSAEFLVQDVYDGPHSDECFYWNQLVDNVVEPEDKGADFDIDDHPF